MGEWSHLSWRIGLWSQCDPKKIKRIVQNSQEGGFMSSRTWGEFSRRYIPRRFERLVSGNSRFFKIRMDMGFIYVKYLSLCT